MTAGWLIPPALLDELTGADAAVAGAGPAGAVGGAAAAEAGGRMSAP
ncbi:hypothetical protein [Mycobacterium xenopi]|nr:hypothetical protein [Mycobacterium xenopi]MDA3642363.1 hypothetical protein [Mycobacterium xenopi]MDA3660423.1 hypothetical protein [Mycobacterium xenopi]MDA3665015.1 hypothetical protein [Mycobacterium xenopi]